jgi:hypothetical protein
MILTELSRERLQPTKCHECGHYGKIIDVPPPHCTRFPGGLICVPLPHHQFVRAARCSNNCCTASCLTLRTHDNDSFHNRIDKCARNPRSVIMSIVVPDRNIINRIRYTQSKGSRRFSKCSANVFPVVKSARHEILVASRCNLNCPVYSFGDCSEPLVAAFLSSSNYSGMSHPVPLRCAST